MSSRAGSAFVPSSRTVVPLTVTRPSSINCSDARREATPAWERIFCKRSITTDCLSRRHGEHEGHEKLMGLRVLRALRDFVRRRMRVVDYVAVRPLIIAIDGPSGAGKGTVARSIADALGYRHVDSGAMYRAVGWKAQQLGLALDDERSVIEVASKSLIEIWAG